MWGGFSRRDVGAGLSRPGPEGSLTPVQERTAHSFDVDQNDHQHQTPRDRPQAIQDLTRAASLGSALSP